MCMMSLVPVKISLLDLTHMVDNGVALRRQRAPEKGL